jgi:F0F1-type ATP synthase assembly protein I
VSAIYRCHTLPDEPAHAVAFLLSPSIFSESAMSSNVLADAARRALRTLMWQAVVVMILAAVATMFWDVRAGVSVLAGGGIGLIWTMYMAYALFKHSLNHGVHMTALTFVTGWLIKVALTVALLIAAFRSGAFVPPAVLAGLACALVAYGVAQARVVSRPGR